MRTTPLRETLFTDWDKRIARCDRRFRIGLRDAHNALSWHALGGNRFFSTYWEEIAQLHRWVFVIGCNNSGTSLLQRLLEWTGEISTFPAEGQLYTRAIKRDRKRGYSRVWSEYIQELALGRDEPLSAAPRLLHDWMTNLPRPIGPVIVEKTPANAARAEWLQKVFPNSRFIGLVRNGYAVAEGIRRKAKQPLDSGARHWNAVNRLMRQTSLGLDRYLEMRYEDLASDPAASMIGICDFIGIENEQSRRLANLTESEAQRALTTIFGPVRNCNPESISRLSNDDISIIRNNAGEMLEYHRYKPV